MRNLYRSETDKMLGGVCGGLGAYLRIDPTFVRIFFVVFAMAEGIGVWVYLLLWLLLPTEERGRSASDGTTRGAEELAGRAREMGDELREAVSTPNPQSTMFIGVALVSLGFIFLLGKLDIPWLSWFHFGALWPVLLIAAGVLLLIRYGRGE